MRIKYAGPMLDYSGYGETSRNHISALKAAGVTVIGEMLSYSSEQADYGTLGPNVHEVMETKGAYDIKLIHSTPDEFARLAEPDKYNIGFCYWETDKIPDAFVEGIAKVNEIWTGSQANFDAIRKAGVGKPIKIIPQPIEVDRKWPKGYKIHDFDGYMFYSIFEWTDRKNPNALLEAYYQEFNKGENVGLLLKTYYRNFSFMNKNKIKNSIQMTKDAQKNSEHLPPVFTYLDLLDRDQMMRIHVTGDCFVSTHRGEGWGLPQADAALCGNPIISTAYGGIHEYFTDNSAMLIKYEMTQLKGMLHSQRFYNEGQKWADVSVKDVRKAMRKIYSDRKFAKNMGELGKQVVTERFNYGRVGSEMAEALKTVRVE